MNSRLKQIRKDNHETQGSFAEKLGLNGNYIYLMESGSKPISDKVIYNVCRVYGVNERWFRTGEGEMYNLNVGSGAAIEWAMETLAGSNRFKKEFLIALSRLPTDVWEVIEEEMTKVIEATQKEKDPE